MGIFTGIKNQLVKPAVNVTGWMSWTFFKDNTVSLARMLKPVFTAHRLREDEKTRESFEHALERLGLTETDLARKAQFLKTSFTFYMSVAVFAALYIIYLFFHADVLSLIVTVLLFSLFLAKAFQMRFWLFQIKQRKLGCSFSEWWSGKAEDNS
ncbi:MAG: type IVB secretion system protein IcmV [Pseudomonadota bacterium]